MELWSLGEWPQRDADLWLSVHHNSAASQGRSDQALRIKRLFAQIDFRFALGSWSTLTWIFPQLRSAYTARTVPLSWSPMGSDAS